MTHRDVELLAIGAGPSSLALAVALEEAGPDDLAENTLLIEQGETIAWQRGMLMPWAQSQVSFLKDLVTQRNPRSKFSFLNYLHSVGRLDEFINLGTFWPYRVELSEYFQWVAGEFTKVKVEHPRQCLEVKPIKDGSGVLTGWLSRLADGSTIASRFLAIGIGRDAYVPPVIAKLSPNRVIHSTEYVSRIAQFSGDVPHRVAVIGGAQSAAEMFHAVQSDLPNCQPTMIMRSIGLNSYETSKFSNELYFASFVDEFYGSRPESREQILREMHRTNYGGLTPTMLETLYRQIYLDRLAGKERLRIITLADITNAQEDGDEVVLELTDRKTGAVEELRCDLVLLGTGFVRAMPRLVRQLADAIGLDRIEVTRDYRLHIDAPATAACYLQGVNEATHGIADSLLSILAQRAAEIADSIVAHRARSALIPRQGAAAPLSTAPVAGS
jgi:L-ornithine N5-oxygenase